MPPATIHKVNARLKQLAVKHALQTITPAENRKFARYQDLRRASFKRSQSEIVRDAETSYQVRILHKMLRKLLFDDMREF